MVTHHKALILPFKENTPIIDPTVLLCPGAVILGDVHIGEYSSVWFNTVIRGDVFHIRIGQRTNIQDLSMLHVTYQRYPLIIGDDVTVGHSAIVHGATIENSILIGMGAKILDRAIVRSNSIVAAGSVVREGFEVPEGTLVAGVPAKIVRELTEQEREKILRSAHGYIEYAKEYKQQFDI